MSEPWLYFIANFITQLLVVLIHTLHEKKLANLPRILGIGVLSSIIPGPLCDLLGKYFGLGVYVLGFGPLSLFVNTVFMYSLFAANVLLAQNARLLPLCIWTCVYVAVFEITNLFFPMWTYSFAVPSIEYFVVAFGAPLGLALSFALAWHVLFRYRFAFIEKKVA